MAQHERSGYLFVNKSEGLTSSDVVIRLKKRLHLDSIGHTGTLDRFAEGLLIIPYGDYTAFSELFLGLDKSYYAEVILGKRTDSGDPDGELVDKWDEWKTKSHLSSDDFSKDRLASELAKITSWTEQKAPLLSALKVDGMRQSDHVRRGREVKEKIRNIQIHKVWDCEPNPNGFSFRIHVSSGTYIRKIVMDLSDLWGVPLQLGRLVRETIGPWGLAGSLPYETIEFEDSRTWQEVLPLPYRYLDERETISVIHGGYIWDKLPKATETGFYFLEEATGQILAWCRYQDKSEHLPYRYRKVFFNPSQKIMFSN
ncbi:tRNA pseudouridine(55) synthase TruB [Leptospira sp. 'Mane']|uniref:tRNA pseudouridine(55) synthase TruB n=1 Tax=Leptospira sp. 'Mane' TaxID=3387407 RepID=UPI00398AB26E